ncbi:MAG TPA: DUF2163 domain-containing protein [Novosphingobium sp.]|nr:DUF2163 domain-containing protein [Novosphingobium sp.]
MSRVWFSQGLEAVATYWRIARTDGVALGFTTHDADLWFDGVLHQACPGMIPAAIRRSAAFDSDSAEVTGAITHAALNGEDLVSGRFDNARVIVGLVDWETLEHQPIYSGSLGQVSAEDGTFVGELLSRKAELARDIVPRTSPTCRADFCGTGCALSAVSYTHEASVTAYDSTANAVTLSSDVAAAHLVSGALRWLDGPYAGMAMGIVDAAGSTAVLDTPLDRPLAGVVRVLLLEGCDRTLATCAGRFGNTLNFQGEPFLPGNDLILRYGLA